MSRIFTVIGVVLTVLYLAFSWWLVGDRVQTLRTMDLNGVGDFLAGVFGPLTIIWLVLGYFQQGDDLDVNTKALLLQNESLKLSVAEQKRSFEQQEEKTEREAEPYIELEDVSDEHEEVDGMIRLKLTNHSTICEKVTCSIQQEGLDEAPQVATFPYLAKGQSRPLNFYGGMVPLRGLWFVVRYKKITGTEGEHRFYIRRDPQSERQKMLIQKP